MRPLACMLRFTGLAAALLGTAAPAVPVAESEAVATAESWYASEVNAPTTPLSQVEKQGRLAAKNKHAVSYVLGRDDWQRGRKSGPVVAYVVEFEPSGFVVVSGDDAVDPILAYNATGTFDWGGPDKNFMSHFLGRCVVSEVERVRNTGQAPHANWTKVRQSKDGTITPKDSGPQGSIYVLWPTAVWGQGDHYNDVCVANNGNNNVPTGCTATAMAIKMRFHEWPWWGSGSHSYNDTWGSVRYSHSANFAHAFNWGAMPTNTLTADNTDVANLMYECGVATDMDYELSGSGAWLYPSQMNGYFLYRGTGEIRSGTPSDHTSQMSYSIQCGLPVILSSSAHTVVAAGYRDTMSPNFYLNVGWNGGSSGWYNLDAVPGGDPTIDRSYPYSSPNNFAYVDASVGSSGNGDLQTPYKTVAAGQTGVTSGGKLWLKTGTYTGTGNTGVTLNKPMTVTSYLGEAVIR